MHGNLRRVCDRVPAAKSGLMRRAQFGSRLSLLSDAERISFGARHARLQCRTTLDKENNFAVRRHDLRDFVGDAHRIGILVRLAAFQNIADVLRASAEYELLRADHAARGVVRRHG